jgi:hypothetical protein
LFDHVDTYDKQRSLRSNQNDNKFEWRLKLVHYTIKVILMWSDYIKLKEIIISVYFSVFCSREQ